MGACFLEKFLFDFREQRFQRCANLCLWNPRCHLFCMIGNECNLFKTWVTAEYSGMGQDYGFDSCHTSWFYENNLAPKTVHTIPSAFPPENQAPQSVNGYFCYSTDSCGITNFMSNPWWLIDLQGQYLVTTLVLKLRGDEKDFENVIIRFGNSSTMSLNPIFNVHPGKTPSDDTDLIIKALNATVGRYLSFQRFLSPAAITICEIQIIGT
ncbi:uncharacterized protein LOC135196305 [Macrobrachium nipponense]|uniref:uncharacterized protein LOC135196305 n=1 Tax=Macrobrachium nipponense TaxID=159736 RepID=UPI0030C89336